MLLLLQLLLVDFPFLCSAVLKPNFNLDMKKVDAMAQRIRSIRPDMELELLDQFFLPDEPLPQLERSEMEL